MTTFIVVDDEADVQLIVRMTIAADPRFTLVGSCATAEDAIALAAEEQPDLVVLDQSLDGELTGIDAAPAIRAAAPDASIILFSANENLRGAARRHPDIAEFLVKTELADLRRLACRICGLD